jgi:hypothetical protein
MANWNWHPHLCSIYIIPSSPPTYNLFEVTTCTGFFSMLPICLSRALKKS